MKSEHGTPGPQGLQGSSRVDFTVDGAEALDFRLDGVPVSPPVRVERVGRHTLELRPKGLPDARPETLVLTVVPPRVELTLTPLAEAFQVRVRVVDEKGQPLDSTTALTLRGLNGTRVEEPLQRQADGSLLTRALPSVREGGRVAEVEALWGDTPVPQSAVEARLPRVEPPPAPSVGEEVALVSLLGVPSGGGVEVAPLPTAFLPQAWLLELRAQSLLDAPGVDVAAGRLSLAVDGRLSERVALGGVLTSRPGSLLGGEASPALAASLSGRVSVSDFPSFRVLLSFDGTWASPGFGTEARGLRLRPGLLAGGRWGRWAFSTSQAYALRPGEARAAWDSTYQAWFHLQPRLVLGAELEALVDASPEVPGPTAFAAGLGARWKLGGLELGGSVRRGFGPDSARVWGPWSAQLILGWSGPRPRFTQ